MRILYISSSPPLPATAGGNQRSNILLRALKRHGEVELLLCGTGDYSEADLAAMRGAFGPVRVMRPPSPVSSGVFAGLRRVWPHRADQIAGLLGDRPPEFHTDREFLARTAGVIEAGKFDVIVCRYAAPAIVAGASRFTPCVLDIDDLDTQLYRDLADSTPRGTPKRWLRERVARQIGRLIPTELAKFDGLLLSSAGDAGEFGGVRTDVLPNIPYFAEGRPIVAAPPEMSDPNEILVVASWFYQPNHEGLSRFLARCWGRIREAHPAARLNVVGAKIRTEDARSWGTHEGVTLTGFVDDIAKVYGRASFAIAPVYQGGGTKIKVLEALAHGRTCVVTEHSHRGYEAALRDDESVLVGTTDEQMADACVRLLNDSDLRTRLAAAGRGVVETEFSFDRVCSIVDNLLGRVVRGGGLKHRSFGDSRSSA